MQTEADDDDEPTWLVVIVGVHCLEKTDEKNPPRLAMASEGVGGFTSGHQLADMVRNLRNGPNNVSAVVWGRCCQ